MNHPTPARPIVALLEARMSSELARLVEKHGGQPWCVPALVESPRISLDAVNEVLDELGRGRNELCIFMTGAAVSLLFELAEQLGRRGELVAALRKLTTLARGPKPTAALRGFGVPPTLTAREPFTGAEMLDALSGVEVVGRRVFLFHYGERGEMLAETLLARHAQLVEIWLYRWLLPEDTSGLEQLARGMLEGKVDALAVTCQIQFRHLYQVAERLELERALIRTLNDQVIVGAVGPTCRAILEAHGVRASVMPEHPKMGPLVLALMQHLELRARQSALSTVDRALMIH